MERYINEDVARNIIGEVMLNRTVSSGCALMQEFSPGLFLHCSNVAFISLQMALAIGLAKEEVCEIAKGALLHDIGKVYVPKEILDKPDKLSKEEYEQVKRHPKLGYDILKMQQLSPIALDIVLHHHEAENGSGYPDGSTSMLLETKIVSIADKYDAITEWRPYSPKRQKESAFTSLGYILHRYPDMAYLLDILKKCSGI